MNVNELGDGLLSDTPYADKRRLICEQVLLLTTLSADESASLVDWLYQRSVQLRENEQPEKAFELGRLIIRLGAACRIPAHIALGNMVCGDALNRQSQFNRAWHYFERSQWRFGHIGDEFSWARTVIGRLWCSTHVGTSRQVIIEEFQRAKRIFRTHKDYGRLVTLYLNAGILYKEQIRLTSALKCLKVALRIAKRSAETNQSNIPRILLTIALVYSDQGDNHRAIYHYRRLYKHFHKVGHPSQILILQNIALLEKQQGKYRSALKRLNYVLRLTKTNFPRIRHVAYRSQIECYLDTNDFPRVRNLTRRFLELPDIPDDERAAVTLYLARALAELQEF
jgi:tetratricopeptide (TPR) repeat protein